jgi:UDP-N-acetylglucosamine 2-epimerase (non-hydrolysing)
MPEILKKFNSQIAQSSILQELKLSPKGYFLVSAHREENVDDEKQLRNLVEGLKALHQKYKFPVIVSTHPRTRKRLESLNVNTSGTDIRFLKPFGFFDYLNLQMNKEREEL